MKICWNNLEKLIYRPDRDEWQDKKRKSMFYVYADSCSKCGEPYLINKQHPTSLCSKWCRKGNYFSNYKILWYILSPKRFWIWIQIDSRKRSLGRDKSRKILSNCSESK